MANFKYDIVTLIEVVESKPCLWDKTNENNKNKILRDNSWKEVFQFLEDGYEQLSAAEKKKTGEMIMQKWSNVRDAFMRSLRTKSGQGAKKKYVYSEHLNFLLKVAQKDETESNFTQRTFDGETEEEYDLQSPLAGSSNATLTGDDISTTSANTPSTVLPLIEHTQDRKKGAKSKRELYFVEREILTELKKMKSSENESRSGPSTHPVPNDNEVVLLSFVPHTRDMNETELMDLHMAILNKIKEIKDKRGITQIQANSVLTCNNSSFAARPLLGVKTTRTTAFNYTYSYSSPQCTVTSPYLSPSGSLSTQNSTYSDSRPQDTVPSPYPSPSSIISNQVGEQENEYEHQHQEERPTRRFLVNPYQSLFDSTAE